MTSPSSTWALRRFFQWLEHGSGGIPMATTGSSAAEVIRSDTPFIQRSHLERLLRHDAVALHVPGFYEEQAARRIGHDLSYEARHGSMNKSNENGTTRQRPRNWNISTSRGLESSDVTTLGAHVPYNVALTSSATIPTSIDDYFAGVQVELQSRRRVRFSSAPDHARPQLWPLDLLRLQLDEAWGAGAGLARDAQNRPFGGGLPRLMHAPRWKRGLIHVDELGPLHPHRGLFSANIYLQLPTTHAVDTTSGVTTVTGETTPTPVLQLWPTLLTSRWEWYRHALILSCLASPQDAEAQGKLRRALGPPLTIAVTPGDLIVLSVQRPHAAIGCDHDTTAAVSTRVSLQCFIQHAGAKERLLIDC